MKNKPIILNEFDENIFNKIIRMVETSENIEQLTVCKRYYDQFKEWYSVSFEKETEFECKFEPKSKLLLKEKSKEENNEKNV